MPNKVDRDLKHDRAVRAIAEARFGFPTADQPSLRTFVNEPEPSLGVKGIDGEPLYPDIVVVEHPRNVVKILAEVETSDTVTEEEAERQWRPFADIAEAFYLYVPYGQTAHAKNICKRLKIKVSGVRAWRYNVGMDRIDIADVY